MSMPTATAEPALIGRRFFYGWVLYTVFGCIAGAIIGFIFGVPLHHLFDRWPLGEVTMAICIGAGVGGMQWLVLRSIPVKRPGGWVLAVIAGLTVGLGLHYWVVAGVWEYSDEGFLGATLAFTVAGTLIGLLQWPIIRPHVERSVLWVPASALGWGLSVLLAALRPQGLLPAIAPILLGTVTGGALVWLFRQPKLREAG